MYDKVGSKKYANNAKYFMLLITDE